MMAIVAKSRVIRRRFHYDMNWNDDSGEFFVSNIVKTV